MQELKWGIIGCGDVTEVKSGPAFNKINNSSLVAVMRRDASKAKDYAQRHGVPKWYDNAASLIEDPEINAIYIATPPSSHEEYAIQSIKAGKPVYLEKPMSVNASSARNILEIAAKSRIKLSVAHYRREQPMFKKIKQLIDEKAIGDVRYINLTYTRPVISPEDLAVPRTQWRVDPGVAGGGFFHDLAPHQLDLMLYFFGDIRRASGISTNQASAYVADDIVAGNILFENDTVFSGIWCFNVQKGESKDNVEIVGSQGKIEFSVFSQPQVLLTNEGTTKVLSFDKLMHVQQPMIEQVVKYFLHDSYNPCSGDDGVHVMELIDDFTSHKSARLANA